MKPISNLPPITIIILIITILLHNPSHTKAEITTSDNWTMQIEDISINHNPPPPKNQKKQTPPNTTQNTRTVTNYKGSLSFSISNNLIDYGFISPTNSIYRTSNLTISNNTLKKFTVFAYQNHPLLTTDTNTQIPDSTCDNGSCSEITPSLWSNTLTYGFGFHCDNITGINCPADMKENNYYKQFPDAAKNEPPQTIMTGKPDQNRNNQIQITYKINTSKTQTPGLYSNTITYIATPGF